MKMLFMDDDTDYRTIQMELFRRDGYEVVESATLGDAEEALALHGEDCDVAVLDMNMPPEMEGGLRIARAIYDQYPLLPALVLTAYGSTDNASRCMLEGVCAYVRKEQGEVDLPLGLRYCYGQRVARIRSAIERSLAAWWMRTGAVALRDSRSLPERRLLPLVMQYFNVMTASMLCRPSPNHRSQLAAIGDVLPLAGYHGPVKLEYGPSVQDMPLFRIRSEVDSFPEMEPVLKLLLGQGNNQSVLLSFTRRGRYGALILQFGEQASPDGIVRFKRIISGGDLESENDALVAMWAVQLTALRGLCRIEQIGAAYHLSVTLPIE